MYSPRIELGNPTKRIKITCSYGNKKLRGGSQLMDAFELTIFFLLECFFEFHRPVSLDMSHQALNVWEFTKAFELFRFTDIELT